MPRYWWHHVVSGAAYNAMVNYWWDAHPAGIGNPYDAFLTALLALKDLPPSEREYWRTMFAAHVFQTEGDVLAHLPLALRGSLGAMKPRDREGLRNKLKENALRSP
ncbi:MAG: hypothetical protein EOP60_19165 [Sphingomonadales bacterium]|nr:MAG: hypothetical protein EOP60_19165 [Sphingomonadales bacterium]